MNTNQSIEKERRIIRIARMDSSLSESIKQELIHKALNNINNLQLIQLTANGRAQ
jgi:hypothetical protein